MKISPKQAFNCLPKKDKISVYLQAPTTYTELLWSASKVKEAFLYANKIKINNGVERLQGHGIEVSASDGNNRYEMLFVEHDEEKLKQLEKELTPNNAR